MNKHEFIAELRKGLSGYPKKEVEERLTFYGEMIDDRMEDGVGEDDAVAEAGNTDEIISQIIADISLTKIVRDRIKPKKKRSAFANVLLVLGAPVWLPLLISAAAVLLSVYVVIWSVVISLCAAEAAIIAGALAGFAMGIWSFCIGSTLQGAVLLCAGCVLAGLSVFLFFVCRASVKGAAILTEKIAMRINSLFQRKGNE